MANVIQLNANTWSLEDGFVRFFLVEGESKAVLIDSGASCPEAAELAKGLTSKSLMLLNTHGDPDHTSGTGAFTEIYMHAADFLECGVSTRFPETKLREVNDGDVIDLGGRTLRIIHIPGHTNGSIAILDEKNRALFVGDTVQKGHIYMFGKSRNPKSYEESLDKLIAINSEYDTIYASHAECVLPGDYAVKVKGAWEKVINGNVSCEIIDLWGQKIKSYTTEACGFYME